jgi:hypothetical protein
MDETTPTWDDSTPAQPVSDVPTWEDSTPTWEDSSGEIPTWDNSTPTWDDSTPASGLSEESKEGGYIIPASVTNAELEEIAARRGIPKEDLKKMALYQGVGVEGEYSPMDYVRRATGIGSEIVGGIPTFVGKKAMSLATGNTALEHAMDELNQLSSKKKYYAQSGAEIAASIALPAGVVAKVGQTGLKGVPKLATQLGSGAAVGATAGVAESQRGDELEAAALGGTIGLVLGGAVPAIGAVRGALKKGSKEPIGATNKFEELDKL